MERKQHEDVWTRSTTINGYRADEVRSTLQKAIRRGWIEDAVLAAYELYASGPEAEEHLWRRLEVIAVEDVGVGSVNAPVLLESLNAQRLRQDGFLDRFMFSVHAVRLLCEAPKDRTSLELAIWSRDVVASGERSLIIRDFAVDNHTGRGTAAGRDSSFWWGAGGYRLENELNPDGSPWTRFVRSALSGLPTDEVDDVPKGESHMHEVPVDSDLPPWQRETVSQ